MRLEDKNVVITGAARGLGLAFAKRFVEEGARVVLADIDTAEGEKAVAALPGDKAVFVNCDASRRSEMDAAIAACVDRWRSIDVIINNAGIASKANILTIDDEPFDRVLAVNLKSAVNRPAIMTPVLG